MLVVQYVIIVVLSRCRNISKTLLTDSYCGCDDNGAIRIFCVPWNFVVYKIQSNMLTGFNQRILLKHQSNIIFLNCTLLYSVEIYSPKQQPLITQPIPFTSEVVMLRFTHTKIQKILFSIDNFENQRVMPNLIQRD